MTTAIDLQSYEQVVIPPFYCPIPAVQRPDAELIDRESFAWLVGLGACDDDQLASLDRSRCGLSSAWAMPHAAHEGVRIGADIVYLGEAVDETFFEMGRLGRSPDEAIVFLTELGRVMEVPDTPLLLNNRWAEGLRDMRRRVAEFASPLQLQRWVSGWKRLFFGFAWESVCRARNSTPSLVEYVPMRVLGTVGMEILTTLNDAADGYELDQSELDALPVRALTEMNWMLVAIDNDLYSYHQERLRHPNGLNFIDVIARTRKIAAGEAVREVIAMRDRVMTLFLLLRDQVRVDASENLCRYLDSLGQWLRANIDWGITSDRYRRPLGPESAPDTWAKLPTSYAAISSDSRLEPIPVPIVAWWWDQIRPPEGARGSTRR